MKKATIAKLLVVCLIVGMMAVPVMAAADYKVTLDDIKWDGNAYKLTADTAISSYMIDDGVYKIQLNGHYLTTSSVTVKSGSRLDVYAADSDAKLVFSATGRVTLKVKDVYYTSNSVYGIGGSVTLEKGGMFKYLNGAADGVTVNYGKKGDVDNEGYVTWTYYREDDSTGGGGSTTPTTPVKPTDPTKPDTKPVFTDVPATAYYADAVAWAVENGITAGLTDSTFGPDASCTRAQMVTFLWRLAGSPKASGTNPFGDVDTGSYYYDAVMWAVANGITSGTADDAFSPNATVNRAQSVTFLYRYAGKPATSSNSNFNDVASDAYYADAVAWAAANGITQGTTDTTFSPDNDCVRGQIVTFMYRYAGDK